MAQSYRHASVCFQNLLPLLREISSKTWLGRHLDSVTRHVRCIVGSLLLPKLLGLLKSRHEILIVTQKVVKKSSHSIHTNEYSGGGGKRSLVYAVGIGVVGR